jgi:hypothetical protein
VTKYRVRLIDAPKPGPNGDGGAGDGAGGARDGGLSEGGAGAGEPAEEPVAAATELPPEQRLSDDEFSALWALRDGDIAVEDTPIYLYGRGPDAPAVVARLKRRKLIQVRKGKMVLTALGRELLALNNTTNDGPGDDPDDTGPNGGDSGGGGHGDGVAGDRRAANTFKPTSAGNGPPKAEADVKKSASGLSEKCASTLSPGENDAGGVSYRVKHEPAQTIYTMHCPLGGADVLTMPQGAPLPPQRARQFCDAERRDEPERWKIECRSAALGFTLSVHPTKEEARAALLVARRNGAGEAMAKEILAALGAGDATEPAADTTTEPTERTDTPERPRYG